MLSFFLRRLSPHRSPLVRRERRASPRRATRLRPGKVLGADRRFVADCAILDRSTDGCRARLFGPTPEPGDVLTIYDESQRIMREARLVWRREAEAGFILTSPGEPVDDDERRRIDGPYYAVLD